LILCWIGGVLIFAVLVNWTVNGRSILPMVPAAGILLARRLETIKWEPRSAWAGAVALGAGALVSLAVTWADYDWANVTRKAAQDLNSRYQATDRKVWFDGHWGFQYYMQQQGALPVDANSSRIHTNDRVVMPSANSYSSVLPAEWLTLVEKFEVSSNRPLTTMSKPRSGFYSDLFGALPFAFGSPDPEFYYVLAPLKTLQLLVSDGQSANYSTDSTNQAQVGEIVAEFESRIAANPRDAEAHSQLGAFLMDHNRVPEAEEHLREALRLRPVDAHAHERLGLLAQNRGQTADAVAHYRTALKFNTALPSTLNNLSWILATSPDPNLRDGDEAVRLAKRACTLTGNDRAVLVGTLAAAYAEAGKFKEAIATAERAKALATAAGQDQVAAKNEQLLQLYRQGKPYHDR
jgi:Flp pilus assembly protein TadD